MWLLKKTAHTLLFGNLFVACCGYFLCLEELFFYKRLSFVNPYSLFLFFATLLIYNYRKFLFPDKEQVMPDTARSIWISSHRGFYGITCLIACLGMLVSLFNLSSSSLLYLVPLFIISLFYATPLSIKKTSKSQLRSLPFLKIFLVAGVWSFVTVVFPQLQDSNFNFFSGDVAFQLTSRFLFLFAITLPFDIRDMHIDAALKIVTFPIALGVKKTVQLAQLSLLLFCVMYLIYLFSHSGPDQLKAAAYILSGLLSILVINKCKAPVSEYYVSFGIEGLMLLQFCFIAIARVIAAS